MVECYNSPYLLTCKIAVSYCVLKECSKGTARCVTFTCPLLNMTDSAKIYVRSRLWNSTMLEVSSQATVTHTNICAYVHTHTDFIINVISNLKELSWIVRYVFICVYKMCWFE